MLALIGWHPDPGPRHAILDGTLTSQCLRMSAFGTKQTWACALQMSAIGGKADMEIAVRNVRF